MKKNILMIIMITTLLLPNTHSLFDDYDYIIERINESQFCQVGGNCSFNILNVTINNVNITNTSQLQIDAFTDGSILFVNDSLVAEDNNNLYYNEPNNRVGIGTNTPNASLQIIRNDSTLSQLSLGVDGVTSNFNHQFVEIGGNTWSYFFHNGFYNGSTVEVVDNTKHAWGYFLNGDVTDSAYIYTKRTDNSEDYPFVLKNDGRLKLSTGAFAQPSANIMLDVEISATNYKGIVVDGAIGQTERLQEWKVGGGANLIEIDKDGLLITTQLIESTSSFVVGKGNIYINSPDNAYVVLDAHTGFNAGTIFQLAGANKGTSDYLSASNAYRLYSYALSDAILIADYDNGFIGIGTSNPTSKLDVRGNVSLNDTLYVETNRVGIGRIPILDRLELDGTASSLTNDNSEFSMFVNNGTCPVYNALAFAHDSSHVSRDAHLNGSLWKSCDAGSNSRWAKNGDTLTLYYDNGIAVGGTIPWHSMLTYQLTTGDVIVVNEMSIGGDINPDGQLDIEPTGTAVDGIDMQSPVGYTARHLDIYDSSGNRLLVLDSDGDLGIGTASPNEKLTVIGNANITGIVYATPVLGELYQNASDVTNISIAVAQTYYVWNNSLVGDTSNVTTNTNGTFVIQVAGYYEIDFSMSVREGESQCVEAEIHLNGNPLAPDSEIRQTIPGFPEIFPSEITNITGTLESGTLEDGEVHDGRYMVFAELGGVPPVGRYRVKFIDREQLGRIVEVCGFYDGSDAHDNIFQCYDNTTGTWERKGIYNTDDFPHNPGIPTCPRFYINGTITDYYNNDNELFCMINHTSSGGAGHKYYFDSMALLRDQATTILNNNIVEYLEVGDIIDLRFTCPINPKDIQIINGNFNLKRLN